MEIPPEIAFRNVDSTPELKERILGEIEKLETVYDRIVTCRVTIEEAVPRNSGQVYHVRLEVSVPNGQVLVNREPSDDPESHDLGQAITQAFDRAWRKLRELKERQRGRPPARELHPDPGGISPEAHGGS